MQANGVVVDVNLSDPVLSLVPRESVEPPGFLFESVRLTPIRGAMLPSLVLHTG
jgi:hypothetical protein